ncbi:hypothetical protein DOY81_002603 [Sarcophaga bullata]|nr:hypothetical protein DOY81_002603 [Sarcophaga bullata]
MGEIKSVKVDNWGVFFLQKLQNFFNKTDYCDLTLQFRDNSQLKVHRLVLSACTDYFNVLEQTCEVVDDAIIMPNGLQADVVVPIVNFMYTGTLEFELKMYNRLLRTAKDMNMTVLLKLLEAHRRTMEMHPQKATAPSSPKQRRKTAGQTAGSLPVNAGGRSLIQTNQGKRMVIGSNSNLPQHRTLANANTTRLPTSGPLPVRQIGSTTFTRIKQESEQQEINTQSGYTVVKQSQQQQHATPTSPFEQLRKGYNNNKRPAVTSFISPPAKKPNLEDVKEFAEQQRMRKQIAAEYGDDDYDASNIMDDDTIHNDDDDDEMMTASSQTAQTSATSTSAAVQTVPSQQTSQQSDDPPGTTTIIVKHEGPDKPPTIVVKDSSNSKMNHTKIISEVLRQYPHLIKSNKNIKLKIMPNAGGQAQKIIVKKEPLESEKSSEKLMQPPTISKSSNIASKIADGQQSSKTLASNIVANRPKAVQQSEASAAAKSNSGTQAGTNKTTAGGIASTGTATSGQPQKRRIDSKTMHALIALGAENTTGPWLCLRCGRNGHPISIPSYRGFRRHLINTHKEHIDPALCEHCGWRSSSKRELHFHMQMDHKIKTNLYIFPECQLCQQMCIDSDGLNQHLIDSHPDENKQQCIYCNKIFPEEIQLYTHMKTFHKKQALEDGIIDYSDDENQQQLPPLPPTDYEQDSEQEQQHAPKQGDKKIKILSDISLPATSSIIKTDSFTTENVTQQESAASTASEEYLHEHDHSETKFVAADGSEVILTPEQRKEILSQLNQEHDGSGVVMVLNENQEQYITGETHSDQGAISQDETSQATTATNEEREEDVEEEEDEQHDDNQIYNAMKALNSNMGDDSISQTETAAETETLTERESGVQDEEEGVEAEHEEVHHEDRPEHLDESKESMDNLEWAENLISEHDLADEALSQTATETAQSNKTEEKEEEVKDEDNKSQDEISKKLKELTGDWSEDDDEDLPEEQPIVEATNKKEEQQEQHESLADVKITESEEKVNEKLAKVLSDEPKEFEDHADLLASLQSVDKNENEEIKETVREEAENIDEDDIDMALKSLHKEDIVEENLKAIDTEAIHEEKQEPSVKIENEIIKEKTADEVKDTDKVSTETKDNIKSVDAKDEKLEEVTNKDVKIEKVEEKLAKELETVGEPDTSTAMEVDEETKKDLIDSLLSEQAAAMEETAAETPTTTDGKDGENKDDVTATDNKTKINLDLENIKELTEHESSLEDEFLNITPEKIDKTEDEALTHTGSGSTTASTSAITTEASSSTKEATITSEERVKSLISEWGDDEDDDDNDADLTANL